MKHFVATRKAHPVLGGGSCDFLPLTNKAVLSYLRQTTENQMLIVCNLSDQPQQVILNLPNFVGRTPHDVLSDQSLPSIREADYSLSLAPYQYYWLALR